MIGRAKQTLEPETSDITRNSACDVCYQVPKALEFCGLLEGGYDVGVKDIKPTPVKGV